MPPLSDKEEAFAAELYKDGLGGCATVGNGLRSYDPKAIPSGQAADSNGFKKWDKGKPRPELIPAEALLEVASILALGAEKYGDWNWVRCKDLSRYEGAAQRHLLQYQLGEYADEETGYSHIAHAICNLLFLYTLEEEKYL